MMTDITTIIPTDIMTLTIHATTIHTIIILRIILLTRTATIIPHTALIPLHTGTRPVMS